MREKVSNIYYVAGKSNYQLSIISYCTYFAMALGSVICGFCLEDFGFYILAGCFIILLMIIFLGKFPSKFFRAKFGIDEEGIVFHWCRREPEKMQWNEVKHYLIAKPLGWYKCDVKFMLYLFTTEMEYEEFAFAKTNIKPGVYCIVWDKENAKILLPYIQFYLSHTLK